MSVPTLIDIAGVATSKSSHGGVIASRLKASAKKSKVSAGVEGTSCPRRGCTRASAKSPEGAGRDRRGEPQLFLERRDRGHRATIASAFGQLRIRLSSKGETDFGDHAHDGRIHAPNDPERPRRVATATHARQLDARETNGVPRCVADDRPFTR